MNEVTSEEVIQAAKAIMDTTREEAIQSAQAVADTLRKELKALENKFEDRLRETDFRCQEVVKEQRTSAEHTITQIHSLFMQMSALLQNQPTPQVTIPAEAISVTVDQPIFNPEIHVDVPKQEPPTINLEVQMPKRTVTKRIEYGSTGRPEVIREEES